MSDYEQPTIQTRRRSRVEKNRLAEQNEVLAAEVYSDKQVFAHDDIHTSAQIPNPQSSTMSKVDDVCQQVPSTLNVRVTKPDAFVPASRPQQNNHAKYKVPQSSKPSTIAVTQFKNRRFPKKRKSTTIIIFLSIIIALLVLACGYSTYAWYRWSDGDLFGSFPTPIATTTSPHTSSSIHTPSPIPKATATPKSMLEVELDVKINFSVCWPTR